jgi:hypothetical protein
MLRRFAAQTLRRLFSLAAFREKMMSGVRIPTSATQIRVSRNEKPDRRGPEWAACAFQLGAAHGMLSIERPGGTPGM